MTIFHAIHNPTGRDGYAKLSTNQQTWLFIETGSRDVEDANFVDLQLLGEIEMARAQHEADDSLAAKVCGY